MKTIIIEITISIILSYISLGIINCKAVKNTDGFVNKAFSVFNFENVSKWYCFLMIVYQVAIVLILNLVYENALNENLKLIFLTSLLWPMAFIDYKQKRIPNKIVIVGLIYRAIILVIELLFIREGLLDTIITELIAVVFITIFIVLCMLIMKGSIGFGDLKFLMMMALFEGIYRFITTILVIMIIAFFAAIYLLIFKKKGKKDSFAFGPIIACGTFLSLILFGV